MSRVLVDANVLLDVLTDDPKWYAWSAERLDACAASGELCINPIIYAEVSVGFERIEALDEALPTDAFLRLPLPDFYIGAHAAIEDLSLLTRDAAHYRAYGFYPVSTDGWMKAGNSRSRRATLRRIHGLWNRSR